MSTILPHIIRNVLTSITILAVSASTYAGPHIHGEAMLHLIINNNDTLQIELIIPAESLIGFEHAPTTAAEHARVKQAKETLKTPLFAFFETQKKFFILKSSEVKLTPIKSKIRYTH